MKTLALILLMLVASTSHAAVRSGWSYALKEGVVNTTRQYLRVINPGTSKEHRLEVRSECHKQAAAEGMYGDCKHTVSVLPKGKTVTLTTGEEVVAAYFGGTLGEMQPVIGTIKYGCCGGPNVVNFYDPTGKSLGTLPYFNASDAGIDRPMDFDNVGDHQFIVTTTDSEGNFSGKSTLRLWTLASGSLVEGTLTPNLPEWNPCIWTIKQVFVKEAVLQVDFNLVQCGAEGKITALCRKSGNNWTCGK